MLVRHHYVALVLFAAIVCAGAAVAEDDISFRKKRSFYRSGKVLETETSRTLDYLLTESGYNRRIRPQFGGDPLQVNVNLAIRSMGPVDENNEVFSLDCYFRQTWTDTRLVYNTSGLHELALNWAFLAKIWRPDTFFVNGKQSFLHKITVPNRFVRISPSGRISYSQRLTIWASCPMNLRKFPLDSQTCHLEIGSFGYTAEELLYRWQANPATIDDDVSLAQFHLADWNFQENIGISTRRTREGFRNDSTVQINFFFERQTGFFLLQIYTPLTLIVFCSWVSFWLVKTDKGGEVPARAALGATTVLSVVNLGFGGKSKPKVGYSTAMDTYVILCFVSVFAALVEFACINFIDTFIKRFKQWEESEKKKAAEREEAEATAAIAVLQPNNSAKPPPQNSDVQASSQHGPYLGMVPLAEEEDGFDDLRFPQPEAISTVSTQDACVSTEDDFADLEEEEEKSEATTKMTSRGRNYAKSCLDFLETTWNQLMEVAFRKYAPYIPQLYIYSNTLDVLYRVDECARRYFPCIFFTLQIIYWSSYIYIF